MPTERYRTESGLYVPDLAHTGYQAFRAALSAVDPASISPDWNYMNDSDQKAWLVVGNRFDSLTDEMDGLSCGKAAKMLYEVYWNATKSMRETKPIWESMPLAHRVAWEGACRHMAMCVEAEDELDFAAEEVKWGTWAEKRMALLAKQPPKETLFDGLSNGP